MSKLRCLDCRGNLHLQKNAQEQWYSCASCKACLVSVNSLSQVVSEFEFNKFKHEISKAQIKSSHDCPRCKTQMIKILGLVRIHEVEVCRNCSMYWLNANEGAQIAQSQINEKSRDFKVNISQMSEIRPSPLNATENILVPPATIQGREFNNLVLTMLNFFGVDALSRNHPILAFLLMIAIISVALLILFKTGYLLTLLGAARVLMGG